MMVRRHVDDLVVLRVVQQTRGDLDAVPLRRQEAIQQRLRAMLQYGGRAPCLDFEGLGPAFEDGFVGGGLAFGDDGVYGSVELALQAISGRPDVLFDVEDAGDGEQLLLLLVAGISKLCFILFIGVSAHVQASRRRQYTLGKSAMYR